MSRAGSLAVGLIIATTVSATASCTAEDEPSQSWACLKVRTMVDLTSDMALSDARLLLDRLTADPSLTAAEAAYAADLRAAVSDGSADDRLGDRLGDVPCTL